MTSFRYQPMFEHGPDETEYRHLTSDHVTTTRLNGREILEVEPAGLARIAREAIPEVSSEKASLCELDRFIVIPCRKKVEYTLIVVGRVIQLQLSQLLNGISQARHTLVTVRIHNRRIPRYAVAPNSLRLVLPHRVRSPFLFGCILILTSIPLFKMSVTALAFIQRNGTAAV